MRGVRPVEPVITTREQSRGADHLSTNLPRGHGQLDEVLDRLAWWSKSRRHDLVTEPERRDLSVDSRVGTEIAERDYKRSCHFLVVGKPGRVRARLRLPIALGEKERVLAAADGRKAHHIEF